MKGIPGLLVSLYETDAIFTYSIKIRNTAHTFSK